MAGAAAMALLLSTSVLLVLCLLPVDPAAPPVAAIPHRRSGRHDVPFGRHAAFGPFATEVELLLHGGGAVPDIRTCRDTLDRLPDWSHFDAELGPLERCVRRSPRCRTRWSSTRARGVLDVLRAWMDAGTSGRTGS